MGWILILALLLGLMPIPTMAATRLGLHVTQEELNIWRQRMVSGPYKSAGDAQINSPGDWDRIVANKNSFISTPPAIWNGPAGTSCLTQSQNDPPSGAERARDAAFYALVAHTAADSTSVKVAVKAWILNQQAPSQLNFANRTLYCEGTGQNPEFVFTISEWMTRLIFAMDYLEILDVNVFSSPERTTLQNWFLAFADFTDTNMEISLNACFSNRPALNYTVTTCTSEAGTPFYGAGFTFNQVNRLYNNRRSNVMSAVAAIGMKFANATYQASAKKFFKELLMFGIFPDGYMSDFLRWADSSGSNPDRGLAYSAGGYVGNMVDVADTLARNGDSELYDFITAAGAFESVGGSKSVLFAIETVAKYIDHTYNRYGTDQVGRSTDPLYRINDRVINGNGYVFDNDFARANLWYQSAYIKSVYLRTAPGTIAYPSVATTQPNGIYNAWMGHTGAYPGVLFMWGQLECIGGTTPCSDPYTTGGDVIAPATPTNLTVTAFSQSEIDVELTKPADGDLDQIRLLFCSGTTCTPGQPPNTVLNLALTSSGCTPQAPRDWCYRHSNLTSGTLYHYQAGALDTSSNLSTLTAEQTAATQEPPPPDPVASWNFDENTGTNATESSNNLDGTLTNGATWTTGEVNSALLCDGSNDYVTVADNALLDLTGDVTIAFWLKLLSTANFANIPSILSKAQPTGGAPTPYHIELVNATTPHLRWWHYPGSGDLYNALLEFTNFSPSDPNVWYHVAFVRDVTARTVKLYTGGNFSQSIDYGSDDPAVSSSALTFCNDPELLSNRYAHIALDEVQIYNGKLDDASIAILAQGAPAASPVLEQATWCTQDINAAESAPCRGPQDRAGFVVTGNQVELRTAIANTSATDGAALSGFALYCRSPAGDDTPDYNWWALNGDCQVDGAGGHPLCYGFSVPRSSGESTQAKLTVGGSTFLAGGKFYEVFGNTADQVAIGALHHIERHHALRVRSDVTTGTTFGCCERLGDGTVLDSCTGGQEAVIRVVAPFAYRSR